MYSKTIDAWPKCNTAVMYGWQSAGLGPSMRQLTLIPICGEAHITAVVGVWLRVYRLHSHWCTVIRGRSKVFPCEPSPQSGDVNGTVWRVTWQSNSVPESYNAFISWWCIPCDSYSTAWLHRHTHIHWCGIVVYIYTEDGVRGRLILVSDVLAEWVEYCLPALRAHMHAHPHLVGLPHKTVQRFCCCYIDKCCSRRVHWHKVRYHKNPHLWCNRETGLVYMYKLHLTQHRAYRTYMSW